VTPCPLALRVRKPRYRHSPASVRSFPDPSSHSTGQNSTIPSINNSPIFGSTALFLDRLLGVPVVFRRDGQPRIRAPIVPMAAYGPTSRGGYRRLLALSFRTATTFPAAAFHTGLCMAPRFSPSLVSIKGTPDYFFALKKRLLKKTSPGTGHQQCQWPPTKKKFLCI
jgi:hypothetical protein